MEFALIVVTLDFVELIARNADSIIDRYCCGGIEIVNITISCVFVLFVLLSFREEAIKLRLLH